MTNLREEQQLRLSVWGAVVFAVTALVWGVVVGSQLIVFDGLYSSISVALSVLSLLAYQMVARGADARYPFGREVFASLAVLVKGVAIGVLCLFALTTAMIDLLGGGRHVAAGWAAIYAATATVGCGVLVLLLRRGSGPRTALVRAEAAQWLLDTVLSAAILVGFLAAIALDRAGHQDLAVYVDPGMVLIVALWFLRLPVRLVREGWGGLVARTPPSAIEAEIVGRVDRTANDHGFTDSVCRVATFGERLDLEVELLVGATSKSGHVEALDRVRADLDASLAEMSRPVRAVVTFTTDPDRVRSREMPDDDRPSP